MVSDKKIEKSLTSFIKKLTGDEIRQLIARGGYIGLAYGVDTGNFDEDDFFMVAGPRDRSNESLFAWDYFFHEGAMQEFDEGDLNPPAGDEDEGGQLDIYPSRIADVLVRRCRQAMLDGASERAEELEARLAQAK